MGKNEMCNFYMMYYFDADAPEPFPHGGACGGVQDPSVFLEYPTQGQSLLPSMPELEEHAHQSAITFGNAEPVMIMRKRYVDSPMYGSPVVGDGGGFRRRRPPLQDAAADWQWQRDRARAPMPDEDAGDGDRPFAASSTPPPSAVVAPPQLCGDCKLGGA
jgi:hypothetical protein